MNDPSIIETEDATIVIIWKSGATAIVQVPIPPYVREASKLWNAGDTAREICTVLNIKVGKQWNAHTEWIGRLRVAYPGLFPLRRVQQKRGK